MRGRIEGEAHDGHMAIVVVDRKEFSRNDPGRMLMGAEGWQVKPDVAEEP